MNKITNMTILMLIFVLFINCDNSNISVESNCLPLRVLHKIDYQEKYKRDLRLSALSSDGDHFFTSENDVLDILIWDSLKGDLVGTINVGEFITKIKVAPKNQFIALLTYPINSPKRDLFRGGYDAGGLRVKFYNFDGNPHAKTIEPLSNKDLHNYIDNLLLSSNGKYAFISIGGSEKKIQKWDILSNRMIFEFDEEPLAYNPTFNQYLAINLSQDIIVRGFSKSGDVTLWNTNEKAQLYKINVIPPNNPFAILSSHTLKPLLAIASELSIGLWDIKLKNKIWSTAISPNPSSNPSSGNEPRIYSISFIENQEVLLIQTTDQQMLVLSEKDGSVIRKFSETWKKQQNTSCRTDTDCPNQHCLYQECWSKSIDPSEYNPFGWYPFLVSSNGQTMLSQSGSQFIFIWNCK